MKRKSIIGILLITVLVLCACSGGAMSSDQSSGNTEPLSNAEIEQMYTNPDNYKNRHVVLTGKVFGQVERDEDGLYFQMYGDPENLEKNTVVFYPGTETPLSPDDYVYISGTIEGTFEGENAFGGTIIAATVIADTLEVISYVQAVSPTIQTIGVNETQNQYGYMVTLDRVEIAENETRVYLSVHNMGESELSLFSYSSKIIQSGRQFEQQTNWEADYPDIQSDIFVGVSSEGIIPFPAIEYSDFQFIIEGYSGNWHEDLQPYVFNISVPVS